MDIRKELPGGEIGISSNEINLMPNSNREGIHAINDGIGEGVDFIVSGVGAIINAGVDVSLSDGYVFLNGETLKVDAQVVPRTVGTDFYQFLKVTTNPSAGIRNFRDSTTQNVYEENRAIAVNVASITDLAVNGDTIQDVLKNAIQVQSDWNQGDNAEPDFIKNKPTLTETLLRGGCIFGDIGGSPSGSLTISGGFTSAVKSSPAGGVNEVVFTFPNVGISTYHVSISVINNTQQTDIKSPAVKGKSATGFTLIIGEQTQVTQNIDFDIMLLN